MARVRSMLLLAVFVPTSLMAQDFDIGVRLPTRAKPAAPAPAAKPGRPGTLAAAVPSQFAVPLEEADTEDAFASVGRGFDPITGRVLDLECVVGTEADRTLPSGATITKTRYDVVTSDRSHQSVSSSSVSVSAVIKVVSLGFGTSSSSSSMFNSVDQFGRLYARIATKGVERRNVKWSDRAERLLKNDLPSFLKQCGTRYVRAVYAGQLFDDTVEFRLRSDQKGSASATSLSVGVAKIFSVGAAFADAQAQLNQISDTRVRHYGRGTLAVPPAPTTGIGPVENEFSYYNSGFLVAVKQAPADTALPLWIEADRYIDKDGLGYRSRIPTWTDQIIAAVLSKIDTYNDLVTAISDLKYVLAPGPQARLEFYKNVTEQDAKDRLAAAQATLADFQKAVVRCQALSTAGIEVPTPGHSAVSECQSQLAAALTPAEVAAVVLPRAY